MKMRPKSRTDNIVVQEMNEEVLVYDLDSNKAVCLNETAAIVWKLCDGKRTASEIAEEVSNKLKKPVADELIWLAIDQLKRENLLSNGEAVETSFNGLTRREVVRKVGIASMVALPLVSSIVAPQAIAAQTVCVAVGTCIQQGQDICAGCIGSVLGFDLFNSTTGICTSFFGPGSTGTCAPGGTSAGGDARITSVT